MFNDMIKKPIRALYIFFIYFKKINLIEVERG